MLRISLLFLALCFLHANVNSLRQRIIGGWSAKIEDYPYQASLIYDGRFVCGAVIISEYKVLAPAHCVRHDDLPEMYNIRAGSTERETGGLVVNVSDIEVNPDYETYKYDYDIAVLYLDDALSFGETIFSVEFAKKDDPIPDCATVAGWGATDPQQTAYANELKTLEVCFYSDSDCKKYYSGITDRLFCADSPQFSESSCVGDAGGALVYNKKMYGLLVGGRGCGQTEYPAVYVNVTESSINSFIENA